MVIAVDNKNHSADELSALFDEIEVGKNLDVEKPSNYETASISGKLRPFSDRCADVKAVMEHEPIPDPYCDGAFEGSTETETETETEPVVEPAPPVEASPEPDLDLELPESKETPMSNDNPLNLSDEDLQAYHKIKSKYPGKFELYDGGQAFKSFYRYKIRALKSILTSYPVLDIKDMNKEILGINTKYQGNELPDPVTIGTKMSECQLARGRVTTLLMQALMQLPAWKKCFEWSNSKLWKDHEIKGAHNREGLSADHMSDIKNYYTGLQGFVDSANLIDGLLKSTHDSLSRQLTCVIIRDKSGMAHDTVSKELSTAVGYQPEHAQPNSDLDGLDTIELGTVIPKVRKGGLVQRDFAGADIEDEFEDIG